MSLLPVLRAANKRGLNEAALESIERMLRENDVIVRLAFVAGVVVHAVFVCVKLRRRSVTSSSWSLMTSMSMSGVLSAPNNSLHVRLNFACESVLAPGML